MSDSFKDLMADIDKLESDVNIGVQRYFGEAALRARIAHLRIKCLEELFESEREVWLFHDNVEMVEHCIRLGYWSFAKQAVRMVQNSTEVRGWNMWSE